MPFDRNADLPDNVKSALPPRAQTLWRTVFDKAIEAGRKEGGAIRLAWQAVKESGWEKGPDGKWTTKKVRRVKIEEVRDEQQIVGGWAYMTKDAQGNQVVDHSGDVIPDIYDLERAAHDYMINRRTVGDMHRSMGCGEVVQLKAITPEWKAAIGAGENLAEGLWVDMKITDADVWSRVKSGELKMFSVGIKAFVENL